MTFGEALVLVDGATPEEAASALVAAGADAIGVNCGVGPAASLEALARMGLVGRGIPGTCMPNAGLPQRIEGRFVYAAGPEWFAETVEAGLASGAAVLGGCCGTTPQHIAAMRTVLDARLRGASAVGGAVGTVGGGATAAEAAQASPARIETPRATPPEARDLTAGDAPLPTRLLERLRAGRFVVSVEIDPPRSIRIDRTVAAARLLAAAGVDFVNISDSAMARVRMGCMAVAFGIQHDLDLECLVHFTTRDRNLMALESELLGAHALGLRNVLALTGDPPRIGDYPTGTGVWDVDSIGLIEILAASTGARTRAARRSGSERGSRSPAPSIPTAPNASREWDRLERKLAAGAHLVMTQPLFGGAGRGHGRRGAPPVRAARAARPGPARHPAAAEQPPRRVPPPRGARHHDPGRDAGGDGRRRRRRSPVGPRDGSRAARGASELVSGTYIMPQLRPLRAGGRAGPADSGGDLRGGD